MRATRSSVLAGVLVLGLFGGVRANAQGLTDPGGSTYLPIGGTSGGFIPYQAGTGGGLGVVSRMPELSTRTPMNPSGMAGGMPPRLGALRTTITPFSPSNGMGMRQRSTGGSSMGGMGGATRPPVGSYPFRQPPSLIGGGSSPAMSM
jgi:hypothetical protein